MRGTLMSAFSGIALAGAWALPLCRPGTGTGGNPRAAVANRSGLGQLGDRQRGTAASERAARLAQGNRQERAARLEPGRAAKRVAQGERRATGGATGSGGAIGYRWCGAGARWAPVEGLGPGERCVRGAGRRQNCRRRDWGGATGTAGTSGTTPVFDMPLRLEDTCVVDPGAPRPVSINGAEPDDALMFSKSFSVNFGGTPGRCIQVKIRVRRCRRAYDDHGRHRGDSSPIRHRRFCQTR